MSRVEASFGFFQRGHGFTSSLHARPVLFFGFNKTSRTPRLAGVGRNGNLRQPNVTEHGLRPTEPLAADPMIREQTMELPLRSSFAIEYPEQNQSFVISGLHHVPATPDILGDTDLHGAALALADHVDRHELRRRFRLPRRVQ